MNYQTKRAGKSFKRLQTLEAVGPEPDTFPCSRSSTPPAYRRQAQRDKKIVLTMSADSKYSSANEISIPISEFSPF
jgi:hypothetical protein